jgi:hypothetical protein
LRALSFRFRLSSLPRPNPGSWNNLVASEVTDLESIYHEDQDQDGFRHLGMGAHKRVGILRRAEPQSSAQGGPAAAAKGETEWFNILPNAH